MNIKVATATCAITLASAFGFHALAHCEIPCGIYNDQMRIVMMLEDITTIEKSMTEIQAIHSKDDLTPLDINQVVRWVTNKEEHANKVQEVVTQYFLTQRIKAPTENTAEAQEKYFQQLAHLHQLLVFSMKAKQTVDTANVQKLRELVNGFAELYFSPEDLAHLQGHHEQ
ncbi:MAG TPA: superoxide dismutase [Verrucomicrobia bacterium]|jgi:nickel superoxide dismutase|nr:superoxide dismutase [Verrucomicrobiota bacterium]